MSSVAPSDSRRSRREAASLRTSDRISGRIFRLRRLSPARYHGNAIRAFSRWLHLKRTFEANPLTTTTADLSRTRIYTRAQIQEWEARNTTPPPAAESRRRAGSDEQSADRRSIPRDPGVTLASQ